jgi:hypothetical protein
MTRSLNAQEEVISMTQTRAEASAGRFAGLVQQCREEMADMSPRRADAVLAGVIKPACLRDEKWVNRGAGVALTATLCGLSRESVYEYASRAAAARAEGRGTLEMMPEPVAGKSLEWRIWRLVVWRATAAGNRGAGGGRPWPPHEKYLAQLAALMAERGDYASAPTVAEVRAAIPGVGRDLAAHLLREAGITRRQLRDEELLQRVRRIRDRDRHRTTAKGIADELGTSERRARRALDAAGGVPLKRLPPLVASRADGLVTVEDLVAWTGESASTVTRNVQRDILHPARPRQPGGGHNPVLLFNPDQVMREWPGIVIAR